MLFLLFDVDLSGLIFEMIICKDILFLYFYESFDFVVCFVEEVVCDLDVLLIK